MYDDDDYGPEDIRIGEQIPVDVDLQVRLKPGIPYHGDGLPIEAGATAVFEGVASKAFQPLSLSSFLYCDLEPGSASEGSGEDMLELVDLTFDGKRAWPSLPEPFTTFVDDNVCIARELPPLTAGMKVSATIKNISDQPIELFPVDLVGVKGWPVH